jgi:hypothetical protein
MKGWVILVLLLLMPFAHAATYSTIDWHRLPVYNIYDPTTNRNELITRYSYEDLSAFMTSSSFRQWNDLNRVCESMRLMFGRSPASCTQMPSLEFPRAPTSRAYVMLQVLPRPPAPDPMTVLFVDPVYPPWSPTYNPYW